MTDSPGSRTIDIYLQQLASSSPAPGGGSVSGLVGALAMALGQMVVSLSGADEALTRANRLLEEARNGALAGSEADERAYGGYIAATKLPKGTPEEKQARREAMQAALREAAQTPMRLAELIASMKPTLREVAERGNRHVVSDAQIAMILADAAIASALVNVRVNLPFLRDEVLVQDLESRIARVEAG